MKKLAFNKVYSNYKNSFSHKLSQQSFLVYKKIRIATAKHYPLKEHEQFRFNDNYSFNERNNSTIPQGFDYESEQQVDGDIQLKYIDLFDYLPKEDAGIFKKRLEKYALANKKPKFSSFMTKDDTKRIDNISKYFDGDAFSRLYDIEISNNDYLKKNAPQLSVSVHNLSTSFLFVKYRFYISDSFSNELQEVFKMAFNPETDIVREYNIRWYEPWKFGKRIYRSDDIRQKTVYLKLAEIKWQIYTELAKNFKIYFSQSNLFPPVFSTYHTNIKIVDDSKHDTFWHSIGINDNFDCSTTYNLFIGYENDIGKYEGLRISSFCGGKYKSTDHLPEIAEHNCSDIYGTYLVANAMNIIAERNIAICNKKISKAIRKGRTLKLLKLRATTERKLYYIYRFLSEFSGATLNTEDLAEANFYNRYKKERSLTQLFLNGIPKHVDKMKSAIDSILDLLNNSTEFQTAKANMILQWGMIIITVLSLLVAITAIKNNQIDAIRTTIIKILQYINAFFRQTV